MSSHCDLDPICSRHLYLQAEGTELELTISLFEIYREAVFDLLGGPEGSVEKIPCLEDGHGATSTHLTYLGVLTHLRVPDSTIHAPYRPSPFVDRRGAATRAERAARLDPR